MYEIKERILSFININKFYIILLLIAVSSIIFSMTYVYLNKCPVCKRCTNNLVLKKDNKKEETLLTVDIKGEVLNPGVYTLKEGTITDDAIKAAGGLTLDGTTDSINLSKKLTDEMVIYVPNKTNIESQAIINNASIQTNNDGDIPININTASIDELTKLSGIGPSKAEKIVEYRNANGSFKSIEEIKNVSGIGDKAFEKIKNKITT